jgi:hypothetical protein
MRNDNHQNIIIMEKSEYLTKRANQIAIFTMFLIAFAGLLLILFFSSCSKELGEYLLDDIKNENPYKGNETLIFLSSNNDTIKLKGNGRYSVTTHSSGGGSTYFDRHYVNEREQCSFNDENGELEIIIRLMSWTIHPEVITKYTLNCIFIDISNDDSDNCSSYIYSIALPIITHENTPVFSDSLNIGGYIYNDVISVQRNEFSIGDCVWKVELDEISYCKSHGIIKMKFNDGTVWELLNINTEK